MGRTVICESYLEDYLKSLTKTNGTSVGLLIGQPSTQGKDYIVHLNKIKSDDWEDFKEVQDIDNNLVANHALNETRMLPGGFFVLGIFVINPKNVFEDNQLLRKVKSILIDIRHTFTSNKTLNGNCDDFDNSEKLVLFYSSSSNFYGCKSVSVKTDCSLKPVEWKFQEKATSWQLMETYFELDDVFPLSKTADDQYNTEDNLTKTVEDISNQLENGIFLMDNEPTNSADTLEKFVKQKEDEFSQVHIYLPCPKIEKNDIKIKLYSGIMKYSGIISSKIYVHPKNSFKDVETFIKLDIIRSLGSRIQIHCDSLIENEIQDTIILNELPRRVYFNIRSKCNSIQFSDYIFRGESKETVLNQAKEILDLNIMPKEIALNVEKITDTKEENPKDDLNLAELDAGKESNKNVMIFGFVAALVVLLAAILTNFAQT